MSKRILYISVHSILEYDELCLFTEMGYEVFSLGAYTNPAGHYQLPRPSIPGMPYRPDLEEMSRNMPRTELTWEFINHFDIIIVMDGHHAPDVLERNWPIFKDKRVIWRTIGQSLPGVEKRMNKLKREGMLIVRYSPMEENIDGYIGKNALIRFYKDPDEFNNWNGNTRQVINFSQSLKGRRDFCGYDTLMKTGQGFPFKVYGSGNDNLGEFNGGELSYDAMKGAMRDCRVYLYGGTWPASYTLSLIEAMMTGIPVVAVGTDMWKHKDNLSINYYEVPKIISNGDSGLLGYSVEELKAHINKLMDDHEYALNMGRKGRERAIQLFGKSLVKEQWKSFLGSL